MASSSDQCPRISREGITVLFGDSTSSVDIVFLHGLNGSPTSTWTDPTTGFYWPWELRREIPDARVMVFGYNADVMPQLDRNMIRINGIARSLLSKLANERQEDNEQDRPLIFVSHSLGGLATKMALFEASQGLEMRVDDRDKIYHSTRGLMFFGVPNAGSMADQKKRVRLLQLMSKFVAAEVPPQLEEALRLHSPDTTDLADNFRRLSLCTQRLLLIYSYYEARTFGALGELVVDEFSAKVGYDREAVSPINANHENLVKFSGRDDDNYRDAVAKLKLMKRRSLESAEASATISATSTQTNSGPAQGSSLASQMLPNSQHHSEVISPMAGLQIQDPITLPPVDQEEQLALNMNLVNAAARGDVAQVRRICEQGADVNSRDGPGALKSPLDAAASGWQNTQTGIEQRSASDEYGRIIRYLVQERGARLESTRPELRPEVRTAILHRSNAT